MTETKKSTPRQATKKSAARGTDLKKKYEGGDDKTKAAILKDLRDAKALSWKAAGERIGLTPTAMRGAYSRHVRPHSESVVFPGVGRKPNAAKKAEPKNAAARKAPAKKATAPRKPAAKKVASAATPEQPKAEAAS